MRWIAIAGLIALPAFGLLAASQAVCLPPQGAFSWEIDGLGVAFTNESSGSPPLSFLWDFGDGATSTLEHPAHTYAAPGTYPVVLLVLNPCGGDVPQGNVAVGAGRPVFLPALARRQGPVGPTPTATPGPTPTPSFTVLKVVNRPMAHPGEEVVFTIGFSNSRDGPVQVTVDDLLPAELTWVAAWHDCAEGTLSLSPARLLALGLQVPPGRACQIWGAALVDQACTCAVVNSASWIAIWDDGGSQGTATSPPLWLLPDGAPPSAGGGSSAWPPKAGAGGTGR